MFKDNRAIAVSAILFSAAIAGCGGVGGSVPTLLGAKAVNLFAPNGTVIGGKVVKVTTSLTPTQAANTALAAQPGTLGKVELGEENGVAVYEVHIIATNGASYEAKVDAATGKLLSVNLDDGADGTLGPDTQAGPDTGPNGQYGAMVQYGPTG